MIYLTSVSSVSMPAPENGFPFNLALFQSLDKLVFSSPVTFFVGENGSGKSTLLETIAAAAGSVAVGSSSLEQDDTLAHVRQSAKHLRLAWKPRTHRGFFLRAEDFFGFARAMRDMVRDLASEADRYDGDDYGSRLARGSLLGQRAALIDSYGENLDQQSHGECFLHLFNERFVPGGLYLLDEPEVPLSPLRQLAFLSLLKEMVEQQNAQFIIATHSPILMAYPGALIYSFDSQPLHKVNYQQLEHVTITRDFLNNPDQFLRRL